MSDSAPALLYETPRTVFEAFMNAYYVSDHADYVAEGGTTGAGERQARAMRCQAAWKRFRRAYPDILSTRDESAVQDWVQEEKGRPVAVGLTCTAPAAESVPQPAAEPPPVAVLATEPEEPANAAEVAAEPVGSDAGDDEDDDALRPAVPVGMEAATELCRSVESWAPEEVEDYIISLTRLKVTRANHIPRLTAIAKAARTQNIDGRLLLAGGSGMLVERTSGYVKWPTSILKGEANFIMGHLKGHIEKAATASYADRNPRLTQMYSSSPEWLLAGLLDALVPRCGASLAEVRYSALCTRVAGDRACSLDSVDEDVAKKIAANNAQENYKVVSVVTPDDVREVHHNVVYHRRHGRWNILVSVDFMQHGSALPGHWHLNRAALGEFVPHWGPSNDVFHGAPDCCPLWWLLIPEGYRYRMAPDRAELRSVSR